MSDIRRLSALEISWDAVSRYLEALLAALLGRPFTCTTKGADDNYWSVAAVCDTFTNVEIVRLVLFVEGSDEMLRNALPIDANTSRSLDMSLCRALLKYALKLDWSAEFVSNDALVILGHFPPNVELPGINQNLISIDSRVIDCRELIPMERFIDKLFDGWGTFSIVEDPIDYYTNVERSGTDFDFEEEKLAKAFSELPLMRREVLRLLFVEEKTPEEISVQLHCTVNYVHLQKSRAIKKLRASLLEGGDQYDKE